MKFMPHQKTLLFCLITVLITSLLGCHKELNTLKLDANQIINVSIPKDIGYIDMEFIVPQDAYDSMLSFSIESKSPALSIFLIDPNGQIIRSNESLGSFQFFATPQVDSSKWTFDKVTSPMPGKWMFRFATSNDDKLEDNILVKVSVGLFEKYTGFVKPLQTKVEVGESLLVQLRLSEYGVPSNIEGHSIQVINRNTKLIETIYASKKVNSYNGSLVNPSPSDFYALFTAREPGEYILAAEFNLQQRNKPLKKQVYSNQVIEVDEPSVNLTSIDFSFNKNELSTPSLIAIANVMTQRPIWLVVRLAFTLDGENFEITRNIKLSSQQSAQLNYNFDYANDLKKKLILKRVDLIDFDTSSGASLLRTYVPHFTIKDQATFTPATAK